MGKLREFNRIVVSIVESFVRRFLQGHADFRLVYQHASEVFETCTGFRQGVDLLCALFNIVLESIIAGGRSTQSLSSF